MGFFDQLKSMLSSTAQQQVRQGVNQAAEDNNKEVDRFYTYAGLLQDPSQEELIQTAIIQVFQKVCALLINFPA